MKFARLTFGLLLILGLTLLTTGPASAGEDDSWVIKTSPHSVSGTVDRLTRAVKNAGAGVAAVIDHAAGAEKAGMALPPTTVVLFGNPRIGTPLMQENPQVGIDLPMRVLIWQDGEATRVGYLKPESLAPRYGFAPDNASIRAMTGALDKLTDAATAQ